MLRVSQERMERNETVPVRYRRLFFLACRRQIHTRAQNVGVRCNFLSIACITRTSGRRKRKGQDAAAARGETEQHRG